VKVIGIILPFASSASRRGGIVKTGDTNETRHGFIWSNGTFTTFNVPGDHPVLGTVAFGINDVGAVVGDYVAASDNLRHGFLRSSKGDFKTFDVPGADITIGEGINNAGTIVGAYIADGTIHGFVSNNGVVFTTVDACPTRRRPRSFRSARSGKSWESMLIQPTCNTASLGYHPTE
jgi:uncharacterized membrane protein